MQTDPIIMSYEDKKGKFLCRYFIFSFYLAQRTKCLIAHNTKIVQILVWQQRIQNIEPKPSTDSRSLKRLVERSIQEYNNDIIFERILSECFQIHYNNCWVFHLYSVDFWNVWCRMLSILNEVVILNFRNLLVKKILVNNTIKLIKLLGVNLQTISICNEIIRWKNK